MPAHQRTTILFARGRSIRMIRIICKIIVVPDSSLCNMPTNQKGYKIRRSFLTSPFCYVCIILATVITESSYYDMLWMMIEWKIMALSWLFSQQLSSKWMSTSVVGKNLIAAYFLSCEFNDCTDAGWEWGLCRFTEAAINRLMQKTSFY